MNRRSFLRNSTGASIAFLGLQRLLAQSSPAGPVLYGDLVKDPDGLLDLPEGFSYTVLSRSGGKMTDGYKVPGKPDGMACFPQKDGKIALVRNHELGRGHGPNGPFPDSSALPEGFDKELIFDAGGPGLVPLVGGTTNLLYDPKTRKVEKEFLSLVGTDRNCAGGALPWGSWITCEETADLTEPDSKNHGWCFEVSADPDSGLQKPVPLKALGRFRHEAVAYEEETGILYLTEDRGAGLLYRFVPEKKGSFEAGRLQALALVDADAPDTRNLEPSQKQFPLNSPQPIRWIDMDKVEAPADDLRRRGHKAGAALFARGEGITILDGQVYICCTSGGHIRQGQIFRINPGNEPTLELFLQPGESDLLANGDNICVGPHSQLVICEDLVNEHAAKTPHLRIVTPDGQIHSLARNALNRSEFAGSCFDETSQTLFVNMQTPGITFAIHGPWPEGGA